MKEFNIVSNGTWINGVLPIGLHRSGTSGAGFQLAPYNSYDVYYVNKWYKQVANLSTQHHILEMIFILDLVIKTDTILISKQVPICYKFPARIGAKRKLV